jgi:hypothetical protein
MLYAFLEIMSLTAQGNFSVGDVGSLPKALVAGLLQLLFDDARRSDGAR